MIHWIIIYLFIGAAFGFIANVGMVDSDKTRAYKIKITLGLLFAWPIMIGYVLLLVGAFLIFGGTSIF